MMRLSYSQLDVLDSRDATHRRSSLRFVKSRLGITLIEILISMFVLLFGLMGVAAIFPVASHYVVEGEKKDRGGGLAQIAFEELKARGILQPQFWWYTNDPAGSGLAAPYQLIKLQPPFPAPPQPQFGEFSIPLSSAVHPGHAFVIDPLAAPAGPPSPNDRWAFPISASPVGNPWPFNTSPPPVGITGNQWPVRRMTLPATIGPLSGESAETIFRLRDDLAVEQPDAGDRPSIQRWKRYDNGTPNNFADDQLLARDYVGDYTWLATVVPTRTNALLGLAPANHLYDEFYEVSAVVFYKRDTVPSATSSGSPGSERLIAADFLNSSELAIYDSVNNDPDDVDLALDKLKPGNWIAVMGVNPNLGPINPSTGQPSGLFLMKWYKLLALDEDTEAQSTISGFPSNGQELRFAMVQGPDWPASSYANLRVAILPGVIDVYTRVMRVEVE